MFLQQAACACATVPVPTLITGVASGLPAGLHSGTIAASETTGGGAAPATGRAAARRES